MVEASARDALKRAPTLGRTGARGGELYAAERKVQGVKIEEKREKDEEKKIEPGHSAEGPRDPGLSCPPPQ
jgi:hypothetical protein